MNLLNESDGKSNGMHLGITLIMKLMESVSFSLTFSFTTSSSSCQCSIGLFLFNLSHCIFENKVIRRYMVIFTEIQVKLVKLASIAVWFSPALRTLNSFPSIAFVISGMEF